jgi:PAS domain S-box-containing protein
MDLLDENGIAHMQAVIKDSSEHNSDPGRPTTYKMRHKNGSWVDVEVLSSPVYDDGGHPVGFVGITRDITERKQADMAVRASEQQLKSYIESAGDAIYVIETGTGRIRNCNGRACLDLGYSREELLELSAQAIEFKLTTGEVDAIHHELKAGEVKTIAGTHRRKDGSVFPVEIRLSSLAPAQPEFMLAIARDITERKQADQALQETSERLTHMMANSPTVIYALKVTGDQATPIWISENIEAVLGFSAEAALQPDWWLKQVHPQDSSDALASVEHLFDDFYQHEYHFLHKDGRTIWLHDEHRMVRDEEDQPREIIGAWTDITERKQAEEALRDYNIRLALDVVERTRELQDAQEKLVRQEKLAVLGQLAGGVGHELRNPLAVINNAVYYLKLVQPDADEKISKYHSVIEHEVHNAEKIITDLLDFARARSVDREPVDLPALVQSVLERFPVPESIKTVLEIPADLPQLYVDSRQMEQVLGNLAVNACQAMAGGGALTISARLEKDLVAIAVKDTGTGITAENMKMLFEPLFTTKPRGIGLGLAVSRKLVEANGGRIEVQSEVGQGSTFTLYLPVNK